LLLLTCWPWHCSCCVYTAAGTVPRSCDLQVKLYACWRHVKHPVLSTLLSKADQSVAVPARPFAAVTILLKPPDHVDHMSLDRCIAVRTVAIAIRSAVHSASKLPINCDRCRCRSILSNLCYNTLPHRTPNTPGLTTRGASKHDQPQTQT
jgi:hypothetical protein